MKRTLLMLAIALPTQIFAQQKTPQQKSAVVETEHVHKGASHVHKGVVAPVERHTVTKWRYHRGYKQAQSPSTPAPQETRATKVPTNVQQAKEDK